VRFFKETYGWATVLEEDKGGRFLVGIPELGKFGIVLLLDGANGTTVGEKRLGPEDVILDGIFCLGIIKNLSILVYPLERGPKSHPYCCTWPATPILTIVTQTPNFSAPAQEQMLPHPTLPPPQQHT
jgi:hypothetical protein